MNSHSCVIWLFWAKPPRRSFSSCTTQLEPKNMTSDFVSWWQWSSSQILYIFLFKGLLFYFSFGRLDHSFIMCKPLQRGGLISEITLRNFSLWSHQQPRFHSVVNPGRRKWQVYTSWYCHWNHPLLPLILHCVSRLLGHHQSALSASIETSLFQFLRFF